MSKEGCGCFSAFIILVIALVFLDVPIVWIAVGTVVVIILFNLLFSTPTARPKLLFNKDCRMDEAYFQQISKAVDDLLAEYENACSSPEFVKQIEESGLSQYIDGQPLDTAAEKVRLLFGRMPCAVTRDWDCSAKRSTKRVMAFTTSSSGRWNLRNCLIKITQNSIAPKTMSYRKPSLRM